MNTQILNNLKKNFVLKDDALPFSFKYDGAALNEIEKQVSFQAVDADGKISEVITVTLPDGLKAETYLDYIPAYGSYEWVTYYENTGTADSKTLSAIFDADLNLPFEFDPPYSSNTFIPGPETVHIYNPYGSTGNRNEFSNTCDHIMPGKNRFYKTRGGRSSNDKAPFFDVNRGDKGYIFAIGWTGQWNCMFERTDEYVNVKSCVENAEFYLHPGERIRTTSFVILPYENGMTTAHNTWRKLIRTNYSLIGKPGRDTHGPLMQSFWGGLSSDRLIDRIEKIGKSNLGYECMWIDAGWYGHSEQECLNDSDGDWYEHTGSWVVNKNYHPNEMKDVFETITDAGFKSLLWVEPERCKSGTDSVKEHPDWFWRCPEGDKANNLLLNLGNPDALQWTIDLISGFIEDFNLYCYRQDFNTEPLSYWRYNDEPGRAGLNEIKHIMGLYIFWDTLLEKFPNLMIDNCASGGRRIDIETLRRSFPMWRSDYQCSLNHDPETAQTHSSSFAWWMPYSGSGYGVGKFDSYRMRSCFAPSLQTGHWWCALPGMDFDESYTEEVLDWIRKANYEYLRAREYLDKDYYPLIMSSMDDTNWSASQYHDPDKNEGFIVAFRRPGAVYKFASLEVKGFDADKIYIFESIGEDYEVADTFEMAGKDLLENGIDVELSQKRSSLLYFYKVK